MLSLDRTKKDFVNKLIEVDWSTGPFLILSKL